MTEVRKLWLPGPAGRIEAAVRIACPARALAVVAHPHPLHGGSLHNPLVFHAEQELHRLGLTTLRFNFRGVGESDGNFDEGRGEVDDIAAAVSWLRGLAPAASLISVGYSFGAWCSLRHASVDRTVRGMIAVGLPVRLYPLEELLGGLGRPLHVVQADGDEFGDPAAVREAARNARPAITLHVVGDTTHRFPGRARDAAAEVRRAGRSLLAFLER